MKREKLIGGIIALVPISILSILIGGGEFPFPSSFLIICFMLNTAFSFISIFVQRWVLYWYEANVFEQPTNAIDYGFKYFAIFSSGLNYLIQNICNRLPIIMNKLASIIFFVYLACNIIFLGTIFA